MLTDTNNLVTILNDIINSTYNPEQMKQQRIFFMYPSKENENKHYNKLHLIPIYNEKKGATLKVEDFILTINNLDRTIPAILIEALAHIATKIKFEVSNETKKDEDYYDILRKLSNTAIQKGFFTSQDFIQSLNDTLAKGVNKYNKFPSANYDASTDFYKDKKIVKAIISFAEVKQFKEKQLGYKWNPMEELWYKVIPSSQMIDEDTKLKSALNDPQAKKFTFHDYKTTPFEPKYYMLIEIKIKDYSQKQLIKTELKDKAGFYSFKEKNGEWNKKYIRKIFPAKQIHEVMQQISFAQEHIAISFQDKTQSKTKAIIA